MKIFGNRSLRIWPLKIAFACPDDRSAVRRMLDRMLAHPPREGELDHIIDIAKRAAARLAARPERLPRP